MKVTSVQTGLYETNTYILYDEQTKNAVITDPGAEPERILGELDRLGLHLMAVLLTHGHFDHVGATEAIREATDCKIYVHPMELTMPAYMRAGLCYTDTYDEGDEVSFDSLHFKVLHTPGHSPGSVTLVTDGMLLCGDTLFCGSCGRTDSPGGSWEQLTQSLRRLGELEGDYLVCPGHGDSTTLQRERRGNVFLMRAMAKN